MVIVTKRLLAIICIALVSLTASASAEQPKIAVVFTVYSPEYNTVFPRSIHVKDRTHQQVVEYAKTSDRLPKILRNNVWCSKELDDEYEEMRAAGHGPSYFAKYYGFARVIVLILQEPSYDIVNFKHPRTGNFDIAKMNVPVNPWMYTPEGRFWRSCAIEYDSDGYRKGKKSSEMYDESLREDIDGVFYNFRNCFGYKDEPKQPDFIDEVYD